MPLPPCAPFPTGTRSKANGRARRSDRSTDGRTGFPASPGRRSPRLRLPRATPPSRPAGRSSARVTSDEAGAALDRQARGKLVNGARGLCKALRPGRGVGDEERLRQQDRTDLLKSRGDAGKVALKGCRNPFQEEELRDATPFLFSGDRLGDHRCGAQHGELVTAGYEGSLHVVAKLQDQVPQPVQVAKVSLPEQRARSAQLHPADCAAGNGCERRRTGRSPASGRQSLPRRVKRRIRR